MAWWRRATAGVVSMVEIAVTAIADFEFKGQLVAVGDVLHVPPIYAAALKYRRRVRLGDHSTPPPPAVEQTPEPSIEEPRRKRTYRRRDMRADT